VKFAEALSNALGGARPPVPYVARGQVQGPLSGYGGARSVLLNAMAANGTLYATVSRFANSTSQVTWRLWRKARSGNPADRVEVLSHLALDLWAMPNAYMPRQLFVESFQQHLELVGEAWWVLRPNELGWPESMWVVRPDKICPVPGGEFGLAGYLYYGPNGEQVPLALDEVIRLRMPHPADPGPAGRGMGAAQTILAQVESASFAAQWNRNFFANSAVPGGIIAVPSELNDTSFERLRMQWREQHRGVSAAHRVGILEGGASFTPAASHRDMEFAELLNVSRDVIREAYAMPKFMLGLVDDVNRASADASDAMFGSWGLVPRLERIKQALNTQFLPMFGPSGRGTGQPDVEFDYDNPVPPDAEGERAETTTKVTSFVALVRAGVNPDDAARLLELPSLRVDSPVQAPSVVQDPAQNGVPANA
jgi:HK97 family phage portal protein